MLKKIIKILVIILLVICFNSCDDFYMTDSRIKTVNNDPVQEQEVTEPRPNQEYINSEIMHVPNSIIGTYTTEHGTWIIGNNGISQPVNCSLYPNPLNCKIFLDSSGGTKEVVAEDYYYFHGSGIFEYKGRFYSGDVTCEIIVTGSVITVNGEVVR